MTTGRINQVATVRARSSSRLAAPRTGVRGMRSGRGGPLKPSEPRWRTRPRVESRRREARFLHADRHLVARADSARQIRFVKNVRSDRHKGFSGPCHVWTACRKLRSLAAGRPLICQEWKQGINKCKCKWFENRQDANGETQRTNLWKPVRLYSG